MCFCGQTNQMIDMMYSEVLLVKIDHFEEICERLPLKSWQFCVECSALCVQNYPRQKMQKVAALHRAELHRAF